MNELNEAERRLARISELLDRGSLGGKDPQTSLSTVLDSDTDSVRGLMRSIRVSELLDQGSLGGLAARVLHSTVSDADVIRVRQAMVDIEARGQRATGADTEGGLVQRTPAVAPMQAITADVDRLGQLRSRRDAIHVSSSRPDRQAPYTHAGNTIAIPRTDSSVAVAERSPTALRIALGNRLRKLRERSGITREAAGDALRGGSHAKISRLELGRAGIKERDLKDLLSLYGVVNPDERDMYFDMARHANDPGWWDQYSDLFPTWFETYIGLEQAANAIRTYEARFVPALLQTVDYARAVVRLDDRLDDEIERRVALLTRRQQILTRATAPTLWFVIDESVLRRLVGGARVWHEQVEHLIEMAERPNIRIQVLRYSPGTGAAVGNSFSILSFPEADLPDIVYTEQLTSALYLERRRDVEVHEAVMNRMGNDALPMAESVRYLKQLLAM